MPRGSGPIAFALVFGVALHAHAAEEGSAPSPSSTDAPVPIIAYAYDAHGVPSGSFGAFGYGVGAADTRDARGGGGVTAWVAPIDRLTLVADASRDVRGPFTPSLAGLVRIVGDPRDGFALSALGKFKVDGFAAGPNREMESELESGLLLSYARSGWHLDTNAIGGVGLGDDGETHVEGSARAGYDLSERVRIGVDGQLRARVAGEKRLAGNRTWDFAIGPQALFTLRPVFFAFTAGPTTSATDAPLAWNAVLNVGAASF